MRAYFCFECDLHTNECTACVLDRTPEDFDKSIMNVFCRNPDGKPLWKKREEVSYYDEI